MILTPLKIRGEPDIFFIECQPIRERDTCVHLLIQNAATFPTNDIEKEVKEEWYKQPQLVVSKLKSLNMTSRLIMVDMTAGSVQ